MKILIVSQYFWPESFRINDLAEGLLERGHTVSVLTGMPNYPDGTVFPGYGLFKKKREDYKGIKIFRSSLVPRGNGGGIRLFLNYISFVLFGSLKALFFTREKFDIILAYQLSPITSVLPAILIKNLTSTPLVIYVQDLWPESLSATGAINSRKILNIVNKLVSFIYKKCDIFFVQSRSFISSISGKGVSADLIHYLPNSVELFYKPVTASKSFINQFKLPSGFLVMFAGNIGAAQDFNTILTASIKLKDYKDIHWIILGDGRMRLWVEQQVITKGLSSNFHVLGRYPVEMMPEFFSLADVLLVTLKRDPIFSITIPTKIQSYMACGKPIVACLDGEGARLIDESGSGFTSPPEDADSLADSVLRMYNLSMSERAVMGRKGREYFERNFDRDILLGQLETGMQEISTSAKPLR